jgi:hypothetical protein
MQVEDDEICNDSTDSSNLDWDIDARPFSVDVWNTP